MYQGTESISRYWQDQGNACPSYHLKRYFMAKLTTLERARLRWRARRGMLENDLILTRFLDHYEAELSDEDVLALNQLFEMDDTDLFQVLIARDRKSTRLNSSHVAISYAVFCLKKKNTKRSLCT